MSSSQPDTSPLSDHEPIYQGQFGPLSITPNDRFGVWVYRLALNGAALSFALGTTIVLWGGENFATLQGAIEKSFTNRKFSMAGISESLMIRSWIIGRADLMTANSY